MEVAQGQNWGCSDKEKNHLSPLLPAEFSNETLYLAIYNG
jgi:hypothetical protein